MGATRLTAPTPGPQRLSQWPAPPPSSQRPSLRIRGTHAAALQGEKESWLLVCRGCCSAGCWTFCHPLPTHELSCASDSGVLLGGLPTPAPTSAPAAETGLPALPGSPGLGAEHSNFLFLRHRYSFTEVWAPSRDGRGTRQRRR